MGDPTRLRQILLNLLGNAVKFTLQGGIHARLEAGHWKGDTCILRITNHDSGKGFEQAVADRLFQPFMQDTKRPLENIEGTGLGLSISKSLAEAFGGTIGCDSTPGEGVSFWFILPAKVLQTAPSARTRLFRNAPSC